jgi:2-hydroxychromene-2-carboxylate isomerase
LDTTISLKNSSTIDFWFEFGSNYSYLTVMRIEEVAARHGIAIRWQPFLLGPIFKSFGWENSPFVMQKEKGEYAWIDMARQCKKLGIPWIRPTNFPRSAILPLRVALIGVDQPWMGEYCRKMMTLNFGRDRDIDASEVVTEVLEELNLPAVQIIEKAISEENKLKLRQQTEAAKAAGVFGAPTFFVGNEMFWGNDRLDEALEYCNDIGERESNRPLRTQDVI